MTELGSQKAVRKLEKYIRNNPWILNEQLNGVIVEPITEGKPGNDQLN